MKKDTFYWKGGKRYIGKYFRTTKGFWDGVVDLPAGACIKVISTRESPLRDKYFFVHSKHNDFWLRSDDIDYFTPVSLLRGLIEVGR
jgi:hypothetical protein